MKKFKINYTITCTFKDGTNDTSSDWQTIEANTKEEAEDNLNTAWEDACEDDWCVLPERCWEESYDSQLDVDEITEVI